MYLFVFINPVVPATIVWQSVLGADGDKADENTKKKRKSKERRPQNTDGPDCMYIDLKNKLIMYDTTLFHPKIVNSFLYIHKKNICCGYSLEVPQLMSTHNICFGGETRKSFPDSPADLELCLTHCRLNRLSHTIYWNSPISILGMSGYEIYIFLKKNKSLYYLRSLCKQWRPCSDAAFCGV